MPKIETPTDNRFVQNFIKNGGKFLYSENENEVNKNIALIIEENGWKKSSLFSLDKEISKKFKLDYSFSKNFFNNKFENEKINAVYINFDIKKIEEFKAIVTENNISGLNITIPYKESIINQLDYVDPTAKEIGAVNTIKFHNNILSGYNTDYLGFYTSIKNIVNSNTKALILGTGGASKAIAYTLKILKIKEKYDFEFKESNKVVSLEMDKDIAHKSLSFHQELSEFN